jgi:hypothetical protein
MTISSHMTTINSYKELRAEKTRLKILMLEQKSQIRRDWQIIREDLKPTFTLAVTMKKALTRKASGAVTNLGINLVADGLVRNVLLAKSGGLSRWVIPFLVKNYASHLVGEPEKLVEKCRQFFRKKKQSGEKMSTEPVEPAAPQDAGMEAV